MYNALSERLPVITAFEVARTTVRCYGHILDNHQTKVNSL